MEPNSSQNIPQSQNLNIIHDVENQEKPFCERSFEEVEDGYIDDRGFYTTPNGSFWDDEHNYFNRFGFDKYGGSYDKYGIYQPGAGYDEKTGLYNDQKEFISGAELNDIEKNMELSISKLRQKERDDEITMKKYEKLEEESEDDDEKSNITFDENDIKEAYDCVMNNENNNENIINNQGNKIQQGSNGINGF